MNRIAINAIRDGGVGLVAEATALGGRAASPRHFMLIFGPFGPFSRALAEQLRRGGARATRVILNAGDVADWGRGHAAPYFGKRSGFCDWLTVQAEETGVTDLLLYGDSHPYCLDAQRVAERLGLKVHVLEQGYFRPDWVTLEPGGVNGNSSLPKDPAYYRAVGAKLPDADPIPVGVITPPAVLRITLYHTWMYLGHVAFRHFRAPYTDSPLRQAGGHIRRFIAQKLDAANEERRIHAAFDKPGPVFLALLQRPGDSQLLRHSPFRTTRQMVDRVIESFARHAPADATLVFKVHPLDPGLEPHRRSIAEAARKAGVGERVTYIDGGRLSALLPSVAGVISVNSTAGLAAIEFGRPTLVLGTAIYDMPGMTAQCGVDLFWTQRERPDPDLYEAFRRVVMARTQVNGAFSSPFGVAMAAPEVARRLLAS